MLGNRIYVNIHIPKTAGTSFGRQVRASLEMAGKIAIFRNIFPGRDAALEERMSSSLVHKLEAYLVDHPEDQPAILTGHLHYRDLRPLLEPLGDRVRYVTFLREPVSRILSDYYYARSEADPNSATFRERYPDLDSYLAIHDEMNKHLLYLRPTAEATVEETIDEVRRRFAFVGLTERFDADIAAFLTSLGLPVPPPRRENIGPGQSERQSLGARRHEEIARHAASDIAIYRAFAEARPSEDTVAALRATPARSAAIPAPVLMREKATEPDTVLPSVGALLDGQGTCLHYVDLDGNQCTLDCGALTKADPWPLPLPVDREDYGTVDTSAAYWASGHGDWLNLQSALQRYHRADRHPLRLLDFGCATGRFLRHVQAFGGPRFDLWGCDFAPANVAWVRRHLPAGIKVVLNMDVPHLPFPDGHFDIVTAFSVFTHIDGAEDDWLQELRRITAPDGLLYLTNHNEATWAEVASSPWRVDALSRANRFPENIPITREALGGPMPQERFALRMSREDIYNCNVWRTDGVIRRDWSRHFEILKIADLAHASYQSAVILRPRADAVPDVQPLPDARARQGGDPETAPPAQPALAAPAAPAHLAHLAPIEDAGEGRAGSTLSHPGFFRLDHLRQGHPDLAGHSDAALIARLTDPANPAPEDPNPLFDCAWYSRVALAGTPGQNPILAFLSATDRGADRPHPLFCPATYRRTHRLPPTTPPLHLLRLALDALDRGRLDGFHPMIDPAHLAGLAGCALDRAFLLRLFAPGFPALAPHPLVDPVHFSAVTSKTFATLRDLIGQYETMEEDLSTHPLIDPDFYRESLGISDPAFRAVWHYLSVPAPVSPHPLIDHDHYRNAARARTGRAPLRPLEHYLAEGAALSISPSPWFDEAHYRRAAQMAPVAPAASAGLLHYLAGGFRCFSPHPLVNLDAFLAAETPPRNPAARWLATPGRPEPAGATAFIDTTFLQNRSGESGLSPAELRLSYLRDGYPQGLPCNGLVSFDYLARITSGRGPGTPALTSYLAQGLHRRPRVLLAFDQLEATPDVTGWLNLLGALDADQRLEFVIVARRPGALSRAFGHFGHVWHLVGDLDPEAEDRMLPARMERLQAILSDNPPVLALCPVAENPALFEAVSASFDPCLNLQPPGHRVADDSRRQMPLPQAAPWCAPALPAPPALPHREAIRAELGLRPDEIALFGFGPLTFDAGVELFANVAACLLERPDPGDRLRLFWLGTGLRFSNTAYFYARHRLRVLGAAQRFEVLDPALAPRLIPAADGFLHLSGINETRQGLLSAVAARVPAVSTDGPWIAAMLGSDPGVATASAQDLSGIAAAVASILAEPTEARRRAARAEACLRTRHAPLALSQWLARHLQEAGCEIDPTPALLAEGPQDRPSCYVTSRILPQGVTQRDCVIWTGPAEAPELTDWQQICPLHITGPSPTDLERQLEDCRAVGLWDRLIVLGRPPSLGGEAMRRWPERIWRPASGQDAGVPDRFAGVFDRVEPLSDPADRPDLQDTPPPQDARTPPARSRVG